MRNSTGCQTCRDKHLKCVQEPGSSECQRCRETGQICRRDSNFRFKPVISVRQKTAGGGAEDFGLTYDDDQVWASGSGSVTFATPALSLEDLEDEERSESTQRATPVSNLPESSMRNAVVPSRQPHQPHDVAGNANSVVGPVTPSSYVSHTVQSYNPSSPLHERNTSLPNISSLLSNAAHIQSPPEQTYWSPTLYQQPSTTWPVESHHEAKLVHHYIKHIAGWLDVSDAKRHFETEVPQRAAHYPVITYAILTMASQHMHFLAGDDDNESAVYHSKCLQLLIPSLDNPMLGLDENLLAAIVILRLYEERVEGHNNPHLQGGTRLLNSIAHFASSGGLREAAAWVFLRQDIFVSLTTSHSSDLNISNYAASASFHNNEPGDWTNRMTYIYACISEAALRPDRTPSTELWEKLEGMVMEWDESKPWHFRPLWYKGASDGLPEILMAQGAHVAGLQYFHMSRILLAVYDPQLLRLGFSSLTLRKKMERSVQESLRVVVALAVSNERVTNASFQASHTLQACGGFLQEERDRRGAVAFLEDMERTLGWRTRGIVEGLRRQWEG